MFTAGFEKVAFFAKAFQAVTKPLKTFKTPSISSTSTSTGKPLMARTMSQQQANPSAFHKSIDSTGYDSLARAQVNAGRKYADI